MTKRRYATAFWGCLLWAGACDPRGLPPENLTDEAKAKLVAEMYENYTSAFPNVRSLTVEELLAFKPEEVVLVDVRKRAEREVSMIPGAISRNVFEDDPEAWAGRKVVTYCTVGYRSGLYAARLAKQGVDVYNLAGSVLAWTHAGQPLVDAEGETRRVHVYGKTWNLAAEGYEAVW